MFLPHNFIMLNLQSLQVDHEKCISIIKVYHNHAYKLIYFNGMSTLLGLFYTQKLGDRVYCAFLFICFVYSFLIIFVQIASSISI